MKRIFVTLLALALALGGIASAETATPVFLPEMPIVSEPVELSLLMKRYDGAESYDKQWFWKWCEEYTGIHFNVTEYDGQVFEEKANLLFTTGEIPDIIMFVGDYLNNARVVQYGPEEGMLMPLNDLIEEYAPNIKTVFDANPDLVTMSTCTDGNIYTLPTYGNEIYNTTRSYINKRWLDNLGLEMPTTIEEFHDVLVAFKEKDANGNGDAADEIPMGGNWDLNMHTGCTLFLTAYGLIAASEFDMYVEDGTVKMAGYEDNYFEYLKMANRCYTEGLFDEDIFDQDRVESRSKSNNDLVGYIAEDSTALLSGSVETMTDWVGIGALTSEVSDKHVWPQAKTATPGYFAISASCENPEAAIKFADIFFTQEASVFFRWGPQKDSEEALGYDGWYLDENGAFAYDFPKGYDSTWPFRVALMMPMAGTVGSNEYFDACPNAYGFAYTMDAAGIHFREEMDKYMMYATGRLPDVYLSAESIERKSEITATLETYMAGMEKKFITGVEELTAENFEAYRQALRDQGIDEYLAMHQDAYNAMIGA